jgi:hypothetical protein
MRHGIQLAVHLLPVPAFPGTLQLIDCKVQFADIPRFDFALFHFYRPFSISPMMRFAICATRFLALSLQSNTTMPAALYYRLFMHKCKYTHKSKA